jgi:hypothetical protein
MGAYILPDSDQSLIVTFDQTTSEGHEFTCEVTEHEVETGSNIADHVKINPQGLTLELFVTNTPIEDLGRGAVTAIDLNLRPYQPPFSLTPGGLTNAAVKFVGSLLPSSSLPSAVQVLAFDQPFDRVKEVHDQLNVLFLEKATMSVVTSLRTYDNMIMTSVSLPIDKKGGASFTLSFKQVRTVTTASVAAPKPLEKRGVPGAAKGSQATGPVGDQDKAKASSALSKGLAALSDGSLFTALGL